MRGVDRLLSFRTISHASLRGLTVIFVALAATMLTPAMAAHATGHPVASVIRVIRATNDVPTNAQAASAHVVIAVNAENAQVHERAQLIAEYEHTVAMNMKAAAARAAKRVVASKPVQTTFVSDSRTPATAASSSTGGYGCASALAYLAAHAAPGFHFECPGYADGHQAMTCINIPGLCPGTKLIAITIPCSAAYMNEASNSWVLSGRSDAPIDPYGYCPE